MSRHARLLAAATLVPLAAAAALAAAARATPALLSCTGHRLVRPAGEFVFACADGNTAITHTHWTSWGATTATGTTDFLINPCEPSCVASRMHSYPGATIRLLAPKRTKHGLVFTRASISYVAAGKHKTDIAYPAT